MMICEKQIAKHTRGSIRETLVQLLGLVDDRIIDCLYDELATSGELTTIDDNALKNRYLDIAGFLSV